MGPSGLGMPKIEVRQQDTGLEPRALTRSPSSAGATSPTGVRATAGTNCLSPDVCREKLCAPPRIPARREAGRLWAERWKEPV